MSGHTGVVCTLDGFIHKFFWPGVYQDVKRFVCTCEACQLVAPLKPQEKVSVLRLFVIEEPYWRIAADTIGIMIPVVPFWKGHRFLLVTLCYCTCYPEGIPLRSINARKIAEVL